MFEKLFDYAFDYVEKQENGQRFRMFMILVVYAITLSFVCAGVIGGVVTVFEYYELYQYIPLWIYENPILFMVSIGFALLVVYILMECIVIPKEVEDRFPWVSVEEEENYDDEDDAE